MSIADWIEGLAPSGRYTFSKKDVRKVFPLMSATTVATSLHRAVDKGRVFSPCRGFYVVVSMEGSAAGSVSGPDDAVSPAEILCLTA